MPTPPPATTASANAVDPQGKDGDEECNYDGIVMSGPLNVEVHQCSKCRYVSVHKYNVARHVKAQKCLGARVITGDVIMVPASMAAAGNSGPMDKSVYMTACNNNTVDYSSTVNINLVLPSTDNPEDRERLVKTFTDSTNAWRLAKCDVGDIPAMVLSMTRGSDAPPAERTVVQHPDRSVSVGGQPPVGQGTFVRKVIGESFDLVKNIDPATTSEPERMQQQQRRIMQPEYVGAKKQRYSAYEVAKMVSSADHAKMRSLDGKGSQLVRDLRDGVLSELNEINNLRHLDALNAADDQRARAKRRADTRAGAEEGPADGSGPSGSSGT